MNGLSWSSVVRGLAWVLAISFFISTVLTALLGFEVFGPPPERGEDFIQFILDLFRWDYNLWPIDFAASPLAAIGFLALGALGPAFRRTHRTGGWAPRPGCDVISLRGVTRSCIRVGVDRRQADCRKSPVLRLRLPSRGDYVQADDSQCRRRCAGLVTQWISSALGSWARDRGRIGSEGGDA